MAVTPTITPVSIVWNGITWSATDTGGPLGLRYLDESQEVEVRTGDDKGAPTIFTVNNSTRIFVTLVDVKQVIVAGAQSDMVVTLKTKSGTQTVNFAGAVFLSTNGNQPRATAGEAELSFICEWSDGQTNPMS